MTFIASKLRQPVDTEANWAASTEPIAADTVVYSSDSVPAGRYKIGAKTGDKLWPELPYVGGGGGIDRFKGTHPTLAALQTAHPVASVGDAADVDDGAGTNALRYIWDAEEGWVPSSLPPGTSLPGGGTQDDYLRGDQTWQNFKSTVLGLVLDSVNFAQNAAATAADSLGVAIGKLQGQITAILTTLATKDDKDLSFIPASGNYTLTGAERGKVLVIDSTTANVTTVPTGFAGLQCIVVVKGTGQTTFAAGTGLTLKNRRNAYKSLSQDAVITLFYETNTLARVVGDLTV